MKFAFKMKKDLSMQKVTKALEEQVTKAVFDVADQVFSVSQQYAPVDLGTLRKSGVVRYGPGATARISYTAAYAKAQEFGTRPHMPPSSALEGWAKRHGMPGAGFAIARKIAERGTKGVHFLQKALDEVLPNIADAVRYRIRGKIGP